MSNQISRSRCKQGWLGGLVAAVAGLLLACAGPGLAWGPRDWERPEPRAAAASTNPALFPFRWALQFYRATVSRVDGDRCPSYPSCSSYALEAVGVHGPVLGCVLTAGRLVGEADEAAFAPRILIDGKWKVYAPVADDLAFLRGRFDP